MLKCYQNRIFEGFRMFTKRTKAIAFAMGVLSSILISPFASAATYYVDGTNGNDTSGTGTLANPWKTIKKVTDNVNIMVAGDTCLIKAGTYRETVTPANSGTSSSPITFQSYGDGDVIISGTDTLPVSGQFWTQDGTSYYTPMSWTLNDGNQIFQGTGTQASLVMKPEARWPDNPDIWQGSRPATNPATTYTDTWSYMDSAGYTNGLGWFTDAALPSGINWNGCTIHSMSGDGWLMQHSTVTSYVGQPLTTNDSNGTVSAYAFKAGNEYYITGSKALMDSAGEWFYDSTLQRLYFYSSSTPTNVEAKKRYYGFDLAGKKFITLRNLNFFACTIKTQLDSPLTYSTDCTFDGLHMQYLNHSRSNSSFYGITLHDRCVLRNSELAFDSQGLIQLSGNDIRIINNHLHDSGYLPNVTAMIDGNLNHEGGYRNLISHNTLHDSGRALLGSPGKSAIFEYNNLYNAMKLTTDGGIVYIPNLDGGNNIVRYNLMHDSTGPQGHSGASVMGFYLDAYCCNWIVHHNIIWNVPSYAMQLNYQHGFDMVFNNTCWNAGGAITTYNEGALNEDSGTRIFNNLFTGVPSGSFNGSWTNADIRYNLYSDPLFVSPIPAPPLPNSFYVIPPANSFQLSATSLAIGKGIVIPGITNGTAPDMGALESGDWTASCGHNFITPPSPDPTYSFPDMIFCNRVIDGGFESGTTLPTLPPNPLPNQWYKTGTVSIITGDKRSGLYAVMLHSADDEIYQTVSGLQPGRRYILYACVRHWGGAIDNITIGVKNNVGRPDLETSASATDTNWHMYSLPFVTGPASTSVQICIHNVNATSVFVDDIGVELCAIDNVIMPYCPIVHYPFDESSGTTASDSSTHNLNGTLCGGMTGANWVIGGGKFGNALNFDGASNYVDCGNDASLQLTGDLTLSFWIKPTNLLKGRQNPLDKCYTGEYSLTIETNGSLSYYHHRNTPYTWWGCMNLLPAGTIKADGTWQHIVITRDSANRAVRGYYNEELKETAYYPIDADPTVSANHMKIGNGYAGGFVGQIDDVRIYDRALTDGYNVDNTKVLHLTLDESTGATTAWDCSEKGNTGTLTNMTPQTDWINGKIKGALNFDSTNGYVNCGNDPSLQLTGDLTLSFWINPTDMSSRRNLLDKCYTGEFSLTIETDGSMTYYHHKTASPYWWWFHPFSAGTIKADGTWQHIVITRNAATGIVTGYYNGELKNTSSAYSLTTEAPVTSSNPVKIGSGYAGAFKGQMDDVRIYSRCLDWQEILDIALMLNYPYEGL